MKTNSLFLESNGLKEPHLDEFGKPANGTRFTEDDSLILRFKNGLLDGDEFQDGRLVVMPAVEGKGHIEYWRSGKIHRDGNLPAVISEGFSVKEKWENGEFKGMVETDAI